MTLHGRTPLQESGVSADAIPGNELMELLKAEQANRNPSDSITIYAQWPVYVVDDSDPMPARREPKPFVYSEAPNEIELRKGATCRNMRVGRCDRSSHADSMGAAGYR